MPLYQKGIWDSEHKFFSDMPKNVLQTPGKNHNFQPTTPNTFSFKWKITVGHPSCRIPHFSWTLITPSSVLKEAFDKLDYQLLIGETELILVIIIFLLTRLSNTHTIHLCHNSTHFILGRVYGWEMHLPGSTLFLSEWGRCFRQVLTGTPHKNSSVLFWPSFAFITLPSSGCF